LRIRRLTIVTEAGKAEQLVGELVRRGVSGYTLTDCRGAGRTALRDNVGPREALVRLEVLVAPEKFEGLLAYIGREVRSEVPITVAVETVEVIRTDHY
jgi:hypothetical protein